VKFTGVKFNGTNLASTSPSGLDADDRGTGTFVGRDRLRRPELHHRAPVTAREW